MLVYYQWV